MDRKHCNLVLPSNWNSALLLVLLRCLRKVMLLVQLLRLQKQTKEEGRREPGRHRNYYYTAVTAATSTHATADGPTNDAAIACHDAAANGPADDAAANGSAHDAAANGSANDAATNAAANAVADATRIPTCWSLGTTTNPNVANKLSKQHLRQS